MFIASVENMLVTSIDTTLETGVVPTQYIVIISTFRQQSEIGIERWNDVGPIVNFYLGIGLKEKLPNAPVTSCHNKPQGIFLHCSAVSLWFL